MPGGRPTDYRPEYCEKVIEWGKQGKSRAWMCASLDIVPQTLDNWEKANPEFLEATTRARVYAQMWWEDAGQNGMFGKEFNATIWGRNMSCRFRDDWTEKTSLEHSGPDGGAITVLTGVPRVADR